MNLVRFLPWRLQFGLKRITGLPAPCSVHSPSDRIAVQLEGSSPRGVSSAHTGLLPKHWRRQTSLYGAQEQRGERRVSPYVLSLWCLAPRLIFPETSCPGGLGSYLWIRQWVQERQTWPAATRAYFSASVSFPGNGTAVGCLVVSAEQQRQCDCWAVQEGICVYSSSKRDYRREGLGKAFWERLHGSGKQVTASGRYSSCMRA